MSARLMSGTSLARSASSLRSRAKLVLPRLSMRKDVLSPSTMGGKRRAFSPPGCSILITSAPDSASINVAKGPGSSVVKSTTRRPDNGCINSPLELAAGKADEDEPEIRQRKIENIDH